MLFISTGKGVLCMPFADNFFSALKKHKKTNTQKVGQLAFSFFSQMLADTQKLVSSWGKYLCNRLPDDLG